MAGPNPLSGLAAETPIARCDDREAARAPTRGTSPRLTLASSSPGERNDLNFVIWLGAVIVRSIVNCFARRTS